MFCCYNHNMKYIVFFFVALFAYSKLAGPIPFSLISTVTNKSDVFTVAGEGKVVAKPDIAYVSVGIEKIASTVAQAQAQINDVNQKIVAGLKKLGIDAEKARQDAVAQAKRKAAQAAQAAGFKLGRIINYSESAGGVVPQPLYNRAEAKLALETAPTEIQTGSQEIKITVSLSYQTE